MRREAGGIPSLVGLGVGVAALTGCVPIVGAPASDRPSGGAYIVTEQGWWTDAGSEPVETERSKTGTTETTESASEYVDAVRAALPETSPLHMVSDDALEEAGDDYCFLRVEVEQPSLPEVVEGVSIATDDAVVIADAARRLLCPADE